MTYTMRHFRLAWLCIMALIPVSALAQFWDQGAANGAARSDFNSSTAGSYSHPIYIGEVTFPEYRAPGWYSWPNSNWVQFGNTSNGYWVFHANDEPVPGWGTSSSGVPDGPPGQTHPIGTPGQSGYGFHYAHIDENNPEADGLHIIINTDLLGAQGRQQWAGTPFLSVGAERDRGNNGFSPAVLNSFWYYSKPDILRFDAKLWQSDDGVNGQSYRHAGFYVIAEWCGDIDGETDCTPRGIFVDFHEDGTDNFSSIYPENGPPIQRYQGGEQWQWPVVDSFFNPGADWIFVRMDGFPELSISHSQCNGVVSGTGANTLIPINQLRSYEVDLTQLYRCVDAAATSTWGESWPVPFPSHSVQVRGIHWYVESALIPGDSPPNPSAIMWLQIGNPRVTAY